MMKIFFIFDKKLLQLSWKISTFLKYLVTFIHCQNSVIFVVTQEERFTIDQLKEPLKFIELEFLGFSLPKLVKSRFEQYYPEDKKQTNLQNWAKFEKNIPIPSQVSISSGFLT